METNLWQDRLLFPSRFPVPTLTCTMPTWSTVSTGGLTASHRMKTWCSGGRGPGRRRKMRLRPGKEFAASQTCSRWGPTAWRQVDFRGPGVKAPKSSGMCVAGCYRALERRLHSARGGNWTMSRKTIDRVFRRGSAAGRGALRRPPFRWWWCVCAFVCACLHGCSFKLWARRQLKSRGDDSNQTGLNDRSQL